MDLFKIEQIITIYGDKFKVTYDERTAESTVESTNSYMYIYVGEEIEKR